MNFLTSRLFQLARSDFASYFIGYAFEFASSMIPVRRLFEDRTIMAFYHPVPFWDIHYLVVPKRRIPSFSSMDLADRQDEDRILQILQTAQVLARQSRLTQYTVLVNGGEYQDVPQLHFHVVSGGRKDGLEMYQEENLQVVDALGGDQDRDVIAVEHPNPARAFHRVIMARDNTPNLWHFDFFNPDHRSTLAEMISFAQQLVTTHGLDRYTLLTNVDGTSLESPLQFHLVSG